MRLNHGFALGLLVAAVLLAGFWWWGASEPGGAPVPGLPSECGQAIVLSWWRRSDVEKDTGITLWDRDRRGWSSVKWLPCTIGRNGLAAPGEKREGDGRTPRGIFRIGLAFGSEPHVDTKLDYRQATVDDYWVDDPDSPEYNRWVDGKPDAKSYEKLLQPDYRYAAVIEYNTDPVVPGKGSAIFLHVWEPDPSPRGIAMPTSGCVAVHEDEMKSLLKWLDKRKKPVIVIDP